MSRRDPIQGDVHRDRYLRHVNGGQSPEEIAKADNVRVSTVKESIERVQILQQLHTIQELALQQGEVIASTTERRIKAINEALDAVKPMKSKDGKGETVVEMVPDHDVRLAALKVANQMLQTLQPRGKGVSVQVGVVTGGPQVGPVPMSPGFGRSAAPRSFEDILAEAKRRRQLGDGTVNGDVVEATP